MSSFRILAAVVLAGAVAAWSLPAASGAEKGSHDSHAAAHGDAHAHDGGDHSAEHGSIDPLSVDPDLAIWTLIVFLVLLAVLRKFAWGPIIAGLELREKTIAEHIAITEQSQQEAQRLLAQYEARLAGAQDEVRAIIEEARRDAEHVHQEILSKARVDAEAELTRAKREIDSAKDQALVTLSETAANHAVELAGKILGSKLNVADHARLIEQALASFPQGDSRNN